MVSKELVSKDLRDNFIPKNNMVECNYCRKFRRETVSCEKYPEWIPRQKPTGRCPDYEPEEKQN